MKKLICILLSAFLLFITGCSDNSASDDAEYATYSSDNGYTVKYPEKYNVFTLGSQIDFVIMDDETGSNVTIMREEKVDGISDMSENDFILRIKSEGYDDITLLAFDKISINGIPCISGKFSCNESTVTMIIYDASDNTYTATCTILPGTRASVSNDFESVARGLMV